MPSNSEFDQAFLIGKATDPGRSGKNNEDALAVFEVDWQDDLKLRRVQVAVVADGIGGNNAGEVASKIAVDQVQATMRTEPTLAIDERMELALQQANRAIFNTGQNSPELLGMGSTLVMAAIADDVLTVAHVGDSRAYLVRGGVARRLTLDHTWAQEAIEIGRLTPEEARRHPNRNVIKRFLGVDETLAVDHQIIDLAQAAGEIEGPGRWPMTGQLRLQPGDTVLLCSDGLTDELSDAELQAVVRKYEPQAAAEQLVVQANAHGGRDNITVVLLRLPGGPSVPRATAAPAAAGGGKSRLPLVLGAILGLLLVAALAALLLSRLGGDDTAATPVPSAVAVVDATAAEGVATMDALFAPTMAAAELETATATATVPPVAPTAAELFTTTLSGDGISTAVPTRTPSPEPPTRTPTPTGRPSPNIPGLSGSATAAAPTGPAAAPGTVTVALLEPNDGDTRQSEATFRWSVTGGSLPAGQAFEVFFYRAGEDPLRGFGLAAPTTGNSVQVNLAALDATPTHPLDPGAYLWGVRLVQQATGAPLRVLAEGRRMSYERVQQPPEPAAPPTPSCVGALCPP